MRGKKYLLILAVCALFIVSSFPIVVSAGFGVTPPGIMEDRLVPGASITKTIYLVQGNPTEDIDIEWFIESKDIKDWITLEQEQKFVIPAGVQQFPFKVTVTVPQDAELGKYDASVRVKTIPQAADGAGQVNIALGGLITIDLTVGDDVFVEYNITGLDILDIKEREPLKASTRINNTGNVPVAPDSASFELFDKFGSIRLGFSRAENKQFPRVPAFTEESVVLEFPVDVVLAVGEYWGHVKVYDEDGKVIRELRTVFNVSERTFLDIITSPGFIVSVLVGIVVLVLLFVYRRRILKKGDIVSSPTEKDTEKEE